MNQSTRDRILDVAEKLFAEKGFDGVGIREITQQARCNISSISYYFGNKEGLYLAVFKERLAKRAFKLQERFRQHFRNSKKDLRSLVQALTIAYLESPFSEEEKLRHHKLMSREVQHPTEAFNYMMENVLLPFFNEIKDHIKHLTGGIFTEEQLKIKTIGLFAVLFHFSIAGQMINTLLGSSGAKISSRRLKKEVIEFCLKGLEG